jgi:hypothetical protein
MEITIYECEGFAGTDRYLDMTGNDRMYIDLIRETPAKCLVFMGPKVLETCDDIPGIMSAIENTAIKLSVFISTFYIAPTKKHKGYLVRGHPMKPAFLLIPVDQYPAEPTEEFVPRTFVLNSDKLNDSFLEFVDEQMLK